ncbi:DUF3017 domain-containing protein [Streptomyces sp. KMM 9044]|uniref:DUF3017 domain-containing protein n=1 Tax=Streptomyces sp. KMM 9044 TaxID=2744474 RepID=UPI002150F8A4|nr:DUF3017 domain-containing protein [Streptomyces sp. KMM 9044]WAX78378.1 DUF3017 domain-containing protein [Streptomyces sp. KMM 9044]
MPADRSAREADARARETGTDFGETHEPEPDRGCKQKREQGREKGQEREPVEGAAVEEASGGVADEDITVIDPVSAPDASGRPRRATRRFPLFTRDTARPEGGGRAAPGDAPAPARQWPILAVLLMAGLGLLLTALDLFRIGTLLIGAALLVGGALRWALPGVGMLAVRSRFTDIATYGVLGLSIVLLALMAQPGPWLEIPFLKDTLHFTVSNS